MRDSRSNRTDDRDTSTAEPVADQYPSRHAEALVEAAVISWLKNQRPELWASFVAMATELVANVD